MKNTGLPEKPRNALHFLKKMPHFPAASHFITIAFAGVQLPGYLD
ncbi:hypothetical protein B4099_1917 [Heyndrickxia coagulans]|uniref:Uncharacterized protein n=1 Tax=Heyndrickxia coagulans TaxID=1398 RepID=A0A150JY31_HEYCO|nr:hypothetical protein B4099_1917 [Heyndrickxia coagulans]